MDFPNPDKQGKGKKLLVMTTRHIADDVVAGLKEKNYSGFDIVGVMVIDANLVGQEIQGVPAVAGDTATSNTTRI